MRAPAVTTLVALLSSGGCISVVPADAWVPLDLSISDEDAKPYTQCHLRVDALPEHRTVRNAWLTAEDLANHNVRVTLSHGPGEEPEWILMLSCAGAAAPYESPPFSAAKKFEIVLPRRAASS